MATTASRFLKFIALHGLPFGLLLSTGMLTTRILFFLYKDNSQEIANTAELLPAFGLMALVAGIGRGLLLWIFRRE